ncbi:MAG: pitrilysin family protein, partial [Sediminibacterium sp.]|nr:pitrilysin family protein [Sediminibacterium sp.]
ILLIYILSPIIIFAQKIDRTKSPNPLTAKPIQINDPNYFELKNGLKVYVVENNKLPLVSVSLNIDRMPIQEFDKAGYVGLAGNLLRRGTTKLSKAQLDEEIDYLGATVTTSSTQVFGKSLKSNFPKMFELIKEIALHPALNEKELEIIRKQSLSGLESYKDDASAIASSVQNVLMYGKNHPYGEIETVESIKKITIHDIKNYINTYWKPNIGYLIFVGNINVSEAKILTEKYFSDWEKGEIPKQTYSTVSPPLKTYIAIVDRPQSVQSSIRIFTPIELKQNSELLIPATLLNNILGAGSNSRLFKNLREKHGFTYGAYSGIEADRIIGNFEASAEVRNEKTDSAILEFMNEFKKIQTEMVSDEELTQTKNYKSGAFARSFENPSTIANFAFNIARYNLPADYYKNYLTNLNKVSPLEINETANKLFNPNKMIILVVGKAKEIAKSLEKIGEVAYFDIYGNPTNPPKEPISIPTGLSAEDILKNHINAVLNHNSLESIKDVSIDGDANIQNQTIHISQKYVMPSNFILKMTIGANILSLQSCIAGTYKMINGGNELPITDEIKNSLKEVANFIPELYYIENKYELKLVGTEIIDNKDVYEIEIKSPNGAITNNFYDIKTGLKLREVKNLKSAKNITDFKEYAII